jgi:ubiquinone/menaquinone biosynthesis C-methylase UbiE
MTLALQSPGVVLLLTPDQQTLVLMAGGVLALIIVILAVILLVLWLVRRRKRSAGPEGPVEAPELYDLRTADVTEDVRFCVEMARSVGGPVLELGAGTGRVTLPLARTGLVVTGLETSRLMLQRAKLKAEQLSSRLHVEWVEGDITNFALGGRTFRLILAPFNVLQELRDLNEIEKCLRCVADHLEPTGKFVVMVQPPRWDTLKIDRRFTKAVYNPRTGELVNCYQSLEVDPVWQKLRGEYEYEIWDQTGQMRQIVAPFEGSYITCPEMALLLRAAGLQMESVYGSFERDKLTAQSKEMIFVARPLPVAQPPAALPVPVATGKQSAKAPALVTASAASVSASAPAASPATASPPPASATLVLPESKDPSKTPAAGNAGDTVTGPTLPALPAPGASGGSSASGKSPAQGMQAPPPAPQSGRRTTGQRRHSKPSH